MPPLKDRVPQKENVFPLHIYAVLKAGGGAVTFSNEMAGRTAGVATSSYEVAAETVEAATFTHKMAAVPIWSAPLFSYGRRDDWSGHFFVRGGRRAG